MVLQLGGRTFELGSNVYFPDSSEHNILRLQKPKSAQYLTKDLYEAA
jgi:hypothetical protein